MATGRSSKMMQRWIGNAGVLPRPNLMLPQRQGCCFLSSFGSRKKNYNPNYSSNYSSNFSSNCSSNFSLNTLDVTSKKQNLGDLSKPPRPTPEGTNTSNTKHAGIRDAPRCIVVKPTSASKKGNDENSNKDSLENQSKKNNYRKRNSKVGVIQRRFQLHHEIRDSNGKPLWIPGSSEGGVVWQLPLLQASSWLDPASYNRSGGSSRVGTEASRQMLRAKKDVLTVARHVAKSNATKAVGIQGHGVPPQLLRHFLKYAADSLTQYQATECTFQSPLFLNNHNSSVDSSGGIAIRHVRVRGLHGENKVLAYTGSDDDSNLQLYWTVMHRIATRLGVLGLAHSRMLLNPNATNITTVAPTPHHVKVQFQFGLQYPEQLLPKVRRQTHAQHLYPVLEWTPMQGMAAPGHVCIRLQGYDDAQRRPVTLSFDAYFRQAKKKSNNRE